MQSEVRYLFDEALILESGEKLLPFSIPEHECVQYCQRLPPDTASSVHYEVNTARKGDVIQGYNVVLHTEEETADGILEARQNLIRSLRQELKTKDIYSSNFIFGKSWSWLDLHCKELIPPGLPKEEFIRRVTRLMSELYGLTEEFLKKAEHNRDFNPYGWDEEEEEDERKSEALNLTDIQTGEPERDSDLWEDGASATSVSVARVLKMKLRIPEYQRPYKWDQRNVIELLRDIEDAMASSHMGAGARHYRLGTIIVHDDQGTYKIVDGQQRLLTLSLLLFFLRSAPEKLCIPLLDDKETLQHLSRQPESRKQLHDNFVVIKDYFGNRTKLKQAFFNALYEFLQVVLIKVDCIDEAFQLFDSQNTRGRALDPHDLLKAYHLREMNDISEDETEKIVKDWEHVSQSGLADFFGNYLYRIKEWVNGNKANVLDEHNISMFKGITRHARTPYAQFYKSAYCYADMVNSSAMPFVSGTRNVNAFQLDTPIIAGKPFFEYTKHYYNILKDIQNNNKYEGFYINDNIIVKTLDRHFKRGIGNNIVRLMFDTSVLLYVDRFCPETYPTKEDMELFEQFVIYAFIWAYSLRAQYTNLGWLSAQNYIMGWSDKINTFNMYKLIVKQDTPSSLLSALADMLNPLSNEDIKDGWAQECYEYSGTGETLKNLKDEKDGVFENYLYFFQINGFYKN